MMPFGLTNAPAAFMYLMSRVFRSYLNKFVVVFIDNILIYSEDRDEHITHLRMGLQTLWNQQLHSKYKKRELRSEAVVLLGLMISKEGIKVNL